MTESASTPSALAPDAAQAPVHVTGLQGAKRRVVFVVLYEVMAVALSSGIFMLMGQQGSESTGMAVIATTLALVWNLAFNWLFEQWEWRQASAQRSVARRIAHAVGFEGGLALMLIPIMAYWFGVSWWTAAQMEVGLLVFLLVYTLVFNWLFDRIFGLPAAVQLAGRAPPA